MGNDNYVDFVNRQGLSILFGKMQRIIESGYDVHISRFGSGIEVTLYYIGEHSHFQGRNLWEAIDKAFKFWIKDTEERNEKIAKVGEASLRSDG